MSEPTEDYMKLHEKKHANAKILSDTYTLHHMEAYTEAAKKHLLNEKGEVIALRFKEGHKGKSGRDVRKDFVKSMRDFYKGKLETRFGAKNLEDDDVKKLLGAFYGFHDEEVQGLLDSHREKFTPGFYQESLGPHLSQQVRKLAYAQATDHIGQNEATEIAKKIGIEDLLTAPPDDKEARALLNRWRDNEGKLTPKDLQELVGGKLKEYKKKKAA
jgi:hypothetical protein